MEPGVIAKTSLKQGPRRTSYGMDGLLQDQFLMLSLDKYIHCSSISKMIKMIIGEIGKIEKT